MSWPRHKFNAIRTECDGIKFPSKLERRCYEKLKLERAAGKVLFFLRQVPIHFISGTKYVVDFLVFNVDGSVQFLEARGMSTAVWKIKQRMLEAEYPMIKVDFFR